MRCYKKLVIDIATGKILRADSYEHYGPVTKLKGGGSSTTNTTLPKWLLPYAKQFIESYQGEVYDDQGNIISRPEGLDQQVAEFNPTQEAAMGNITGMTGGMQNYANLGLGQSAATIGGAYLNPETNPYIDATYDKAARAMTDQYQTAIAPSLMASAQQSGNFGGSAMNEIMAMSRYDLGENLGNLATSIYGGNYASERDRQLQTLNMLPNTLQAGYMPQQTALGIGAMEQGQEQQVLDTDYTNALSQTQFPFEILSGYGGALGQAGMGSGKSTVNSSGGGGMFGSIICTTLHDFGLMDDETYAADTVFGKTLPAEVIKGYHLWAVPVARAMRKSFLLTALVEPIALSWAKTMRAKIEGKPENETWLGRQLLRFGVPICAWLGRKHELAKDATENLAL